MRQMFRGGADSPTVQGEGVADLLEFDIDHALNLVARAGLIAEEAEKHHPLRAAQFAHLDLGSRVWSFGRGSASLKRPQ